MTLVTDYLPPEAPKQHDKKRRCKDCERRLNIYVKVQSGDSPHKGLLLCDDCVDSRALGLIKEAQEKEERSRAYRASIATKNLERANLINSPGHRPKGVTIKGLKEIRLKMGKSQEWMGAHLGVGGRHISDLERGHCRASVERARVFARTLGVSIDELRGRG